MPNYNFQEVEPETIGTIVNSRVQLYPEAIYKPEVKPALPETKESTLQEIKEPVPQETEEKVKGKLETRFRIAEAIEQLYKPELEEKDRKAEETKKELETKYQSEFKKRDKEMNSFKKMNAQKDKELKDLKTKFKDLQNKVKEALFEG